MFKMPPQHLSLNTNLLSTSSIYACILTLILTLLFLFFTERIIFPFVRYTLNNPTPPAERPRLKYLDCTENRVESGSNRTANGS